MSDNDEPLTTLGDMLRDARTQRHLSQVAAAERAGVSVTLWQQVERGERYDGRPVKPKLPTVLDMAHALGVDPRTALSAAGHDPTAADTFTPAVEIAASEEFIVLLYRALAPAQRPALTKLLRSFFDQRTEQHTSRHTDREIAHVVAARILERDQHAYDHVAEMARDRGSPDGELNPFHTLMFEHAQHKHRAEELRKGLAHLVAGAGTDTNTMIPTAELRRLLAVMNAVDQPVCGPDPADDEHHATQQ